MKNIQRVAAFALIVILSNGCATVKNNNFNSTLWMQASSEYMANSLQIYNTAKNNIDMALTDTHWTAALEQTDNCSMLPAAVIVDIDETVFDNSKYQAKLVNEGKEFTPQTWDDWIFYGKASAIPGAVDFINFMKEKNVEVVYITNRECKHRVDKSIPCPQEQDIIRNFERIGLADVNPDNILLKNEQSNWPSEKKSRREAVASKFRILMLFGDDLADFLPNVRNNITPYQRAKFVHQYKDNWGRKWYMFSNPVYGSWLNVLERNNLKHLVGY